MTHWSKQLPISLVKLSTISFSYLILGMISSRAARRGALKTLRIGASLGSSLSINNFLNFPKKDGVKPISFLRVFRWGSTYNVYSFLRVWMAFDGNFVEVMPAPSVKGQHCGVCGNYNKNKFDDFVGKEENVLASPADMVNEWKWKC